MSEDAVEEWAMEVGVVEVGDKGCIVVVRAIVIGVEIGWVSGHPTPVEMNVSTICGWITFNVKFGVEVIDPKDGVVVDEMTQGVSPEVGMADCWEQPLSERW